MRKLLVLAAAALATAPPATAGVRIVPSLTPQATHALWRAEVARARTMPRPSTATAATCNPARVVFYAQTDWLRVATKLAQQPSPCAAYYVSVPPLSADKTQARGGQASQIRALGRASTRSTRSAGTAGAPGSVRATAAGTTPASRHGSG